MMLSATSYRSLGAVGRTLARKSRAMAECMAGPSVVIKQQRTFSQSSRAFAEAEAAKTAPAAKEEGGSATKTNKGAPSSCTAGTTLSGLGIFKDRGEPVAKPDDAYPEWLWTILDDQVVSADGIALISTDGLSKGEARAVEKRNLRIIRAAQRAKQLKAAALEKAALEQGLTTGEVGLSAKGAAVTAAETEHAWSEREKKRELRKTNRVAIKTNNFVKAQ